MKLDPCPFCGGEAEIERLGDHRRSTIYACCNCGCRLETGEEWGHGADWNKRATETTQGREAVIKNAHDLQELISSVRAQVLEEVTALLASDEVTKDPNGFVVMHEDGLIELINSIETAKIKNQSNG